MVVDLAGLESASKSLSAASAVASHPSASGQPARAALQAALRLLRGLADAADMDRGATSPEAAGLPLPMKIDHDQVRAALERFASDVAVALQDVPEHADDGSMAEDRSPEQLSAPPEEPWQIGPLRWDDEPAEPAGWAPWMHPFFRWHARRRRQEWERAEQRRQEREQAEQPA